MYSAHCSRNGSRPAFSLLELMIVILIISIVYALVFASMQRGEKEPKALQADNLKSTLLEQGNSHVKSEFFCVDKCTSCYLYKDGETSKYEGKLALGDITAYRMGENGKLEKIDFGRYQDHPVCLRFKFRSNGSTSKMVIESKSGIYYLPSLFGTTTKTASLEEAEALWSKYADILAENGGFY